MTRRRPAPSSAPIRAVVASPVTRGPMPDYPAPIDHVLTGGARAQAGAVTRRAWRSHVSGNRDPASRGQPADLAHYME